MSFVNYTGLYQKLYEKDGQKMGNRCCVENTCLWSAARDRCSGRIHLYRSTDYKYANNNFSLYLIPTAQIRFCTFLVYLIKH